jgi:hypothetical protein
MSQRHKVTNKTPAAGATLQSEFFPLTLLSLVGLPVSGILADVRCHINGRPSFSKFSPAPRLRVLRRVRLRTVSSRQGSFTWLRWEWEPNPDELGDFGYADLPLEYASTREIRIQITAPVSS